MKPVMRSEVFLRADLAALLGAIALTADVSSSNDSPHAAAYRRGFVAALAAVATGLHIAPGEIGGWLADWPGRERLEVRR